MCVPGAPHLLSGPMGKHRLIRGAEGLRDWAEAAVPSCRPSWWWWYCWDPGGFWSSLASCHWPEEDKWAGRFLFFIFPFFLNSDFLEEIQLPDMDLVVHPTSGGDDVRV